MSSIRAQAAKAKSKAVKAKAEQAAKAAAEPVKKKNDDDDEDEGDAAEAEVDVKTLEDLRNPDVVTKYKLAGEIANKALELVAAACVVGATPLEVCTYGDKIILEETGKVFNKDKKMEKGVAFPTCLSVNHFVGHFSPMVGEDGEPFAAGDVVKIDLGAQIDGYAGVVATTVVVGDEKPKEKKADLLVAINTAAELAVRLLKPGNKSTQISDMLAKVCKDFDVNMVNGIVSHEMNRFVIDGKKTIQNKPGVEGEKREKEVTFEANEVYGLDIIFTTGDGKSSESPIRTTVYKREADVNYKLKMKASRAIFTDISQTCSTFPFTIRNLDEKKVRFGIVECANHGLVRPFPVMAEKSGDFVAHIKMTVLLMPSGQVRLTGATLDTTGYETEKALTDEDLKKLILTSYGKKKRKKKNNKKKK